MKYPKLRPVQFFPLAIEGRRIGCLHDPMRISDKPLLIPWHLVCLIPCLDGKHSLLDIKVEYTRHSGNFLSTEELEEFLEKLDYYLFLDSERFHEFNEKVKQGFLSSPIRPAFFSGLSYSSDPRILRKELQNFFTSSDGPGCPMRETKNNKRLTAIVAPHIDLKAGGSCYAWAYSQLVYSSISPELFIIIGTCHTQLNSLFSLTDKSFQTPFGIVKCDKEFINILKESYSIGLFSEEFLHRSEHTIEFQILFLQFLWEKFGNSWPPLRICPILCAFTPECLSEGYYHKSIYTSFISSLRELISTYKKNICIILSIDLAHIGPKFGDYKALDEFEKQKCFNEDLIMLDLIAQQDQEGFQKNMLHYYNKRRICGYPPLTALLDILPASDGKLLKYNHSIVDGLGSIVTYGSMAFYEK